jgi:hypothetical protein
MLTLWKIDAFFNNYNNYSSNSFLTKHGNQHELFLSLSIN